MKTNVICNAGSLCAKVCRSACGFSSRGTLLTLFPFVMILTHSTQLGSGSFSHFFVSRFVLLDC